MGVRRIRSLVAVLLAMPLAGTIARSEPLAPNCKLTIELVDGASGASLAGLIQVRDARDQRVSLAELIPRGLGIELEGPIHEWWSLPRAMVVTVPAEAVTVDAVAGLETERTSQRIDLTGRAEATIRVPLTRFFAARQKGLVAGNTHLHLRNLARSAADRYLREVPLGDGLDVVFVSYLTRPPADLDYVTNRYARRDLEELSDDRVHFGHGEEHRHNFGSHGQGYGHILLLDIPQLVEPVSIGPGITGRGADSPPLQAGIDAARAAGGKVVWAHNRFGFEDIPNWITGRVHANNIFDGGEHGGFEDTFYRYLDIGLKVPFSTGTDWFLYDFSRVYVPSEGPITPTEWLERLAAGKSFITNGPLLELTVEGRGPGDELELARAQEVTIRGRAWGRSDFGRIELVRNGRVTRTAKSRPEGRHFVATFEEREPIGEPSWLALRTPPPPRSDWPEPKGAAGPDAARDFPTNELGGPLFAHTSPVYVLVGGRGVFDPRVARGLLAEMKEDWERIEAKALFLDPVQYCRVLVVYLEAMERLESLLARHLNKP